MLEKKVDLNGLKSSLRCVLEILREALKKELEELRNTAKRLLRKAVEAFPSTVLSIGILLLGLTFIHVYVCLLLADRSTVLWFAQTLLLSIMAWCSTVLVIAGLKLSHK